MKNLCFLLFLFVAMACVRPPEYPIEPIMKFEGLSRTQLSQGFFNEDSLLIKFSFTDGDGDIGSEDSLSLFFRDLRSGNIEPKYRLPFVPVAGAENGISGVISVILYNTCCIFDDGTPPCTISPNQNTDTLYYEAFIRDRAGHESPVVVLPPIALICD